MLSIALLVPLHQHRRISLGLGTLGLQCRKPMRLDYEGGGGIHQIPNASCDTEQTKKISVKKLPEITSN